MSGKSGVKRALLSVYDKTGIEPFAQSLVERGVEIISSGGTAKVLQRANIPVRLVQEWTGFPEMLGHRVVTLHPKVHGAILANRDDPQHQADIEKFGLEVVDLVCVSLYPFEDAISKPGVTLAEAIEMIDIGGPTLIRAAAKNHKYVTVVTDPSQYKKVLDEMDDGGISFETRQSFALRAFGLTCDYDSIISAYLRQQTGESFPDRIGFSFRKKNDLRYGENPHQKAAFYVGPKTGETCIAQAIVLPGGKEISYNNYFDANGALELTKDMMAFEKPAVAIIKHANPAGCAVH